MYKGAECATKPYSLPRSRSGRMRGGQLATNTDTSGFQHELPARQLPKGRCMLLVG